MKKYQKKITKDKNKRQGYILIKMKQKNKQRESHI